MTKRVFKSGNFQAARLPKEFQFASDEVEIFKRDNKLIFREKPRNLARVFELLAQMPEDFFAEPRQDAP